MLNLLEVGKLRTCGTEIHFHFVYLLVTFQKEYTDNDFWHGIEISYFFTTLRRTSVHLVIFFSLLLLLSTKPPPIFIIMVTSYSLCIFVSYSKKFWFYWCDHQIFTVVIFSSQALLCLLKLICIRGMGNLLWVVSCWFAHHGDNMALVEVLLEINSIATYTSGQLVSIKLLSLFKFMKFIITSMVRAKCQRKLMINWHFSASWSFNLSPWLWKYFDWTHYMTLKTSMLPALNFWITFVLSHWSMRFRKLGIELQPLWKSKCHDLSTRWLFSSSVFLHTSETSYAR